MKLLALALLGGCDLAPCHAPLDKWCLHSEEEGGPVRGEGDDGPCEPAVLESADSCGEYEVQASGPGYIGTEHYFKDGEHVGTRYWTDTEAYCGGYSFWYGKRVSCE